MSLAEKLDRIWANAAKQIPEPARDLMHRASQELDYSGAANRIIPVGDKFPNFNLPNQYSVNGFGTWAVD